METFNIELNIQEANTILQALGQLPFAQVHQLIRSIQEQATEQLNGKADQLSTEVEEKAVVTA